MIDSVHDESEYTGQNMQRVTDGGGDRLEDLNDMDTPSKAVRLLLGAWPKEYLLSLRVPDLVNFVQVRIFPGKKFDDFDTREEFLKEFGTPIGENHIFLAEAKYVTCSHGLEWGRDDEDSKTSQCTWTQINQEDDEADDQLN